MYNHRTIQKSNLTTLYSNLTNPRNQNQNPHHVTPPQHPSLARLQYCAYVTDSGPAPPGRRRRRLCLWIMHNFTGITFPDLSRLPLSSTEQSGRRRKKGFHNQLSPNEPQNYLPSCLQGTSSTNTSWSNLVVTYENHTSREDKVGEVDRMWYIFPFLPGFCEPGLNFVPD